MLPELTLPASLMLLLGALRPCFTRRSFVTFCGLAAGLAGQVRRRTVRGMLTGAGLAGIWPHDRAHRFFARARWDLDEAGLAVARLVVMLLVPAGGPVTVAVDDPVSRRAGRQVHGAGWQHDGSSPHRSKLSFGTCFVTAGIVVRLPFCTRPACLPVLARLNLPGSKGPQRKHAAKPGSKVAQAAGLVTMLAAAFPGRQVHVVADAYHHGPPVKNLPGTVTWTCRLMANAVLHDLPPAKIPATPGRPKLKGDRPGTAADLAAAAAWTPAAVRIYGRRQHIRLAEVTCLWYGCLHTTRWSIEQAFCDTRVVPGGGEARNRVRRAAGRTVPSAMLARTLIIIWYARHGHDHAGITARRAAQPWYQSKTEPAYEDMLIKLRRVMITARISRTRSTPPTPQETQDVLAAWHTAAA